MYRILGLWIAVLLCCADSGAQSETTQETDEADTTTVLPEPSILIKQRQTQSLSLQTKPQIATEALNGGPLPTMPRMAIPAQSNVGGPTTLPRGLSDITFFSETARTRAVCILLDISQSMISKGVAEDARREFITMIAELNPATKFNAIAFVDGAAPMFSQMVFATQENKSTALARLNIDAGRPSNRDSGTWPETGFVPNYTGNRPGYSGGTPAEAIRMAVEQGCDAMFILTDDNIPFLKEGSVAPGKEISSHTKDIEKYVRGIQASVGHAVCINIIIYKPDGKAARSKEGLAFYRRLAQLTGGKFRLVK